MGSKTESGVVLMKWVEATCFIKKHQILPSLPFIKKLETCMTHPFSYLSTAIPKGQGLPSKCRVKTDKFLVCTRHEWTPETQFQVRLTSYLRHALFKNQLNLLYLWRSCSDWAEILCMCAILLVRTAGPFSDQLEHLSYCELDLDYLDLLDFKLEQIWGHFC